MTSFKERLKERLAEGTYPGSHMVPEPKTKEDHHKNYLFAVRMMKDHHKDGNDGQVDAWRREAHAHGKKAGLSKDHMSMDDVHHRSVFGRDLDENFSTFGAGAYGGSWAKAKAAENRARMQKERDAVKLQQQMLKAKKRLDDRIAGKAKDKAYFDQLGRDMETAFGQVYPDGEPYDWLMDQKKYQYAHHMGHLGQHMDKAARMLGHRGGSHAMFRSMEKDLGPDSHKVFEAMASPYSYKHYVKLHKKLGRPPTKDEVSASAQKANKRSTGMKHIGVNKPMGEAVNATTAYHDVRRRIDFHRKQAEHHAKHAKGKVAKPHHQYWHAVHSAEADRLKAMHEEISKLNEESYHPAAQVHLNWAARKFKNPKAQASNLKRFHEIQAKHHHEQKIKHPESSDTHKRHADQVKYHLGRAAHYRAMQGPAAK